MLKVFVCQGDAPGGSDIIWNLSSSFICVLFSRVWLTYMLLCCFVQFAVGCLCDELWTVRCGFRRLAAASASAWPAARPSRRSPVTRSPLCTHNLSTKIIPAKIVWLNTSGKPIMDMRISPLNIKIVLESNPLNFRILVRRLAVWSTGVWEMEWYTQRCTRMRTCLPRTAVSLARRVFRLDASKRFKSVLEQVEPIWYHMISYDIV